MKYFLIIAGLLLSGSSTWACDRNASAEDVYRTHTIMIFTRAFAVVDQDVAHLESPLTYFKDWSESELDKIVDIMVEETPYKVSDERKLKRRLKNFLKAPSMDLFAQLRQAFEPLKPSALVLAY